MLSVIIFLATFFVYTHFNFILYLLAFYHILNFLGLNVSQAYASNPSQSVVLWEQCIIFKIPSVNNYFATHAQLCPITVTTDLNLWYNTHSTNKTYFWIIEPLLYRTSTGTRINFLFGKFIHERSFYNYF